MPKNIVIRVALLLIVAFGIFVFYSVGSLFIPRHGRVANVSDLRKVYGKGGRVVAATFTNSLIQSFPFDGPVEWRLILFKEPMVFLSGKVDTNVLPRFIRDHAPARFIWSGAHNEIEEGWPDASAWPRTTWTNVYFDSNWLVEGGYAAGIQGWIDVQKSMVTIRSSGSDGPVTNPK
jgi:hypothetical protein